MHHAVVGARFSIRYFFFVIGNNGVSRVGQQLGAMPNAVGSDLE